MADRWPTASCCGEPRVAREVDACYDHAKVCPECQTNPMAPEGPRCPWCVVVAEVYPGAANDIEAYVRAHGGWVCEAHPDKPWPHDDCPGPGMPKEEL